MKQGHIVFTKPTTDNVNTYLLIQNLQLALQALDYAKQHSVKHITEIEDIQKQIDTLRSTL